jgi:hypothetical protein
MRRLVTLLIVGFLAAVVVAATIATLVRDDSNSAARGGTSSSRPVVPRCRPAQLALSIEMRSDRPAIVLRRVSGPRCDVGRLQIATKVRVSEESQSLSKTSAVPSRARFHPRWTSQRIRLHAPL